VVVHSGVERSVLESRYRYSAPESLTLEYHSSRLADEGTAEA